MSAAVSDNLLRKLDELRDQHAAINQQLNDPAVFSDHRAVRRLSIKRAALEPIVEQYLAWQDALSEADDLEQMIAATTDEELVAMAKDELRGVRDRAVALIDSVQKKLVTADDQSVGSIIIEVRAGVGGDEAGLWAADLLEMYTRFAKIRNWDLEELDISTATTTAGASGITSGVIRLEGEGVWASLGYEGGTHQVKRIPATETQGRIHTSTATVAVLPEPEEIEVDLDPNDVKEMITTAQGPGGQNVNKVATAVHLIHEPTGVEVRMQDTKSQAQNREKAWRLLRARLFEQQKAAADAERAEARSSMIGTGSRAEKIRTYRYKDNLVVDHRIGESFNLGLVMDGGLDALIDHLIEHDTAQRLAAL